MEQLSALMDGELDAGEAKNILERMKAREELRSEWLTLHLIGDVLRRESVSGVDFCERFARRLAEEPTVLAPRPSLAGKLQLVSLSAAAGMAAVAAVGWLMFAADRPDPLEANRVREAFVVRSPGSGIAEGPAALEYLAAHREFSPAIATQGVEPYIRAVSSGPEDSRSFPRP